MKAVIEEEIYIRQVNVAPVQVNYTGENREDIKLLRALYRSLHDVEYQGGSVVAWLEKRIEQIVLANPKVERSIKANFRLKSATVFEVKGRYVKLRELSVVFQPKVQWLSQVARLDAETGIYDYVRGGMHFHNGTNSLTVSFDYTHATPLPFSPSIDHLGVGLAPEEVGLVVGRIVGLDLTPEIRQRAAKLDELVRPEDLDPKIRDAG